MYRRLFVLVAVLSIGGAVLVTEAPPSSAVPAAHGTAACRMAAGGTGTLSPGLSPAGSPGGMKINFTAKLVPPPTATMCNGAVASPAGTVVIGGTVQGSGYYLPVPSTARASKCARFASSDKVGQLTVTINWTTSGPPHIAPTTIVYSGNTGTVATVGGHFQLTFTAPTGTATKSGSFAFPPAGPPHTVKFLSTVPSPCGAGPYTSFTIHSGSVSM